MSSCTDPALTFCSVLQVGNIGQVNYAASKAGVEALTRTAAKELSRSAVKVSAQQVDGTTGRRDVTPVFVTPQVRDQVQLCAAGVHIDAHDGQSSREGDQ